MAALQIAEKKIVNGVKVDRLAETIERIQSDPELGRFRFRAISEWISGAYMCTTIKDFYGLGREDDSRTERFVLDSDEPEMLLGEDHGPNATEAVLYALASCLVTTLVYRAAAEGVTLDRMELELEGDLDIRGFLGLSDEVPNGFSDIRVNVRVVSDAPTEVIERLCREAK